jgi:putative membrane protein insertion efficiency factor
MKTIARWLWVTLPRRCVTTLVRFYQLAISPWLGNNCRYIPSCSCYFITSVEKYGVVRGCWRGVRRILRCHPFHPGGYDPP